MTFKTGNFFPYALVALSAFVLIACDRYAEDPGPLQETQKEFDIIGFDRLKMGDAFDVTIQQGDFFRITVRGDRRNIDDLSVTKTGTTLVIGYDKGRNRKHTTYITIAMPAVISADFSGATDAKISGFNVVGDFDLGLSGASVCELDMETDRLDVSLSGASYLNVRGEGETLKATVTGASKLKAFYFPVSQAHIVASGASHADVSVTDKLEADASGASVITYRGNPSVSSHVSGASTVRQD